MKEHLSPIPNPPTMIIAVGKRADEIACDAQSIFLRGAAHREVTSAFLSLRCSQGKVCKLVLQSGDEMDDPHGSERHFPACEFGDSVTALKTELETVLHGLRLHERLIAVGLGAERDLPLGVIILADLTDASATCLPVLLEALESVLGREPNRYVYLLLLTAVFEENESAVIAQAMPYCYLRALKKQTDNASSLFHIFLFDRLKEGVWEVKNAVELQLLAGNFLLALLTGRFAQHLDHLLPHSDILEKEAFYNAASATAVLFDPPALIEQCALNVGIWALEEFCAQDQRPPQTVEQAAKAILSQLGALHGWAERACMETPFRPRPGSEPGCDLHISDLSFEGLPAQEWGDAITGYADYFQRNWAAQLMENQKNNLQALQEEILGALEEQAELLPQQASLFPGGVNGAIQVVGRLVQWIQKRSQDCLPIEKEESVQSSLETAYENALHAMDHLVSSFSALPRWLRRLPKPVYSYAYQLFNVIFRRYEYNKLAALRETCVRALEQRFAFDFEQQMRRSLTDLCRNIIDSLLKTNERLQSLLTAMESLRAQLADRKSFNPALISPFRVVLMDEEVVSWALGRLNLSRVEFRNKLLDENLLHKWYQAGAKTLEERLLFHCRVACQSLRELDIEQLLLQSGEDAYCVTIKTLAQAAVPLLRPDFDLAGDGISFQAQFCLCADPHEPLVLRALEKLPEEWQPFPSGDLSITVCCRVRLMLTASSLQALFERGRQAYESLSEDQRKGISNFQNIQISPEERIA